MPFCFWQQQHQGKKTEKMTRKVLTALSCARLEPHEVLPRPPYHPFPSPHDSPFTHIILPGARGAGRGRGAFCTLPAPLPGSPAVRHQVTTGLRIMYRNDAPQKKTPEGGREANPRCGASGKTGFRIRFGAQGPLRHETQLICT